MNASLLVALVAAVPLAGAAISVDDAPPTADQDLPQESHAQPGASEGSAEEDFAVLPGQPADFTVRVPTRGALRFTVHVHDGAAYDLVLDGPGRCADRWMPGGIAVTAGSGGIYQGFDCGSVGPGTYDVQIRGVLTIATGTVRVKGGDFVA